MNVLSDINKLNELKRGAPILMLFGGPDCGVCQVLKPKIMKMIENRFPRISAYYIDCAESPEICAQHRVFSLPVVKVYIEDRLITDLKGSFGIHQLMSRIERSYDFWIEQN